MVCEDEILESGFEKIVLFSKDGNDCTHLARQLAEGSWTSKLGISYDVTHTLAAMNGGIYGDFCVILKRIVN